MIKKLLAFINIHPDSNQKYLLMSLVVSGLLITYAHPTLLKVIVSELPAQWIAFQSLAMSISGLLMGLIWSGKVRENAIKYFLYLAITESLCGCILGLYLCFVSLSIYDEALAALNDGVSVEKLVAMEVREKIGRFKYTTIDMVEDAFMNVVQDIKEEIKSLKDKED